MSTVRPFTSNCTAIGAAGAAESASLAGLAAAAAAGVGAGRARARDGAGGAEVHEPGVGRQRAGHLVEQVGPDVAIAVHACGWCRSGRPASRGSISWCRFSAEERLEPLVLGAALLQLRRRARSARAPCRRRRSRASRARPPSSPRRRAGAGSLILLPSPRTPSERPGEGLPGALALEVGAEIDGDHRSSVPGSGLRGAAQREADREHQQRRDLVDRDTGRRRRRPPGASRSGWPAGPGCAAGPTAPC